MEEANTNLNEQFPRDPEDDSSNFFPLCIHYFFLISISIVILSSLGHWDSAAQNDHRASRSHCGGGWCPAQ